MQGRGRRGGGCAGGSGNGRMRAMDYLKFIQRICLIASVVLVIGIVVRLFLPLIEPQRELRARAAELRRDMRAREAERSRMRKRCGCCGMKQARLQEDPRFIEKIARRNWATPSRGKPYSVRGRRQNRRLGLPSAARRRGIRRGGGGAERREAPNRCRFRLRRRRGGPAGKRRG